MLFRSMNSRDSYQLEYRDGETLCLWLSGYKECTVRMENSDVMTFVDALELEGKIKKSSDGKLFDAGGEAFYKNSVLSDFTFFSNNRGYRFICQPWNYIDIYEGNTKLWDMGCTKSVSFKHISSTESLADKLQECVDYYENWKESNSSEQPL